MILLLLLACTGMLADAQHLLPQPQTITYTTGHCAAGRLEVKFRHVPKSDRSRLTAALSRLLPETADARGRATRLLLAIEGRAEGAEGYALTVAPTDITLTASSGAGLYHGLQTLAQLRADDGSVACCHIADSPRYAWRGLMLDISRHFFGKSFIEKQIDAMARFKLNTLHLHLTDAAGWRLQIKHYPELTRKAAWRSAPGWKVWWQGSRQYREEGGPGAYGGYLTQQDARDIVDYARRHYINVVPEIEMPAHSEEVLAAYPQLACPQAPAGVADFCPGNEATYQFLENVLTEVMAVFPSEYIHVGGDEAGMAEWKRCPLCQQRMKEEGMTDVKQLQGYLIRRIGRFLQKHGRKLVGWDEILSDSVPANATAMVWRDVSEARKAMDRGVPVVLSPGAYCYLDGYQDAPLTQPEAIGGYLPLDTVYSYCPPVEPLVRGVQGNLWTEYVPTPQHAEYMLWPRAMAIAELGWTGSDRKDAAGFHRRALWQNEQLQKSGYHVFDLSHEVGQRPESRHPADNAARGCRVSYNSCPYSDSYPAAGAATLTDGRCGGWHYRDGRWQGFIGKGMDVTVDLDSMQQVDSVSLTFMQQQGPEIFLPSELTLSVSDDGATFLPLGVLKPAPDEAAQSICYKTFGFAVKKRVRYVRLQAKPGKSGGWLFTDEVVVKGAR